MQKDRFPFQDILFLQHHQSEKRTHMSLEQRAAQFAPFAALTGYEDLVEEEARLTDRQIMLTETEQQLLNQQLLLIQDLLEAKQHPVITVEYFEPDKLKAGGQYFVTEGIVRKVDPIDQSITFYAGNGISAGKTIPFSVIHRISGDWLKQWNIEE